jgi:hypothetical protein
VWEGRECVLVLLMLLLYELCMKSLMRNEWIDMLVEKRLLRLLLRQLMRVSLSSIPRVDLLWRRRLPWPWVYRADSRYRDSLRRRCRCGRAIAANKQMNNICVLCGISFHIQCIRERLFVVDQSPAAVEYSLLDGRRISGQLLLNPLTDCADFCRSRE